MDGTAGIGRGRSVGAESCRNKRKTNQVLEISESGSFSGFIKGILGCLFCTVNDNFVTLKFTEVSYVSCIMINIQRGSTGLYGRETYTHGR